MTRKSKQAGGNMPLTSFERKKYSKNYGTTTQRLSGLAQYKFGHCGLSLHPAKDQPVATPSGYVYERSAILEYLLTKTQQLKQESKDHELLLKRKREEQVLEEEQKRKDEEARFEQRQKVTSSSSNSSTKRQKLEEENPLKRTSYWLAEVQPQLPTATGAASSLLNNGDSPSAVAAKRPPSPNSQLPLNRKDLVELDLKRNSEDQVLCAISDKVVSTQQALALVTKKSKPAQVVLEQVYNDLGKERTCPVTGKKIKKIIRLQKGGSSFAGAGGSVEAKTYRPTMT